MTPHTITVSDGTITSSVTLYIDKNFEQFPFYLVEAGTGTGGGAIDYTVIQNMLDAQSATMCDCVETLSTKVENGNESINQVLITLGDEVNENQSIIEGKNGARMML